MKCETKVHKIQQKRNIKMKITACPFSCFCVHGTFVLLTNVNEKVILINDFFVLSVTWIGLVFFYPHAVVLEVSHICLSSQI